MLAERFTHTLLLSVDRGSSGPAMENQVPKQSENLRTHQPLAVKTSTTPRSHVVDAIAEENYLSRTASPPRKLDRKDCDEHTLAARSRSYTSQSFNENDETATPREGGNVNSTSPRDSALAATSAQTSVGSLLARRAIQHAQGSPFLAASTPQAQSSHFLDSPRADASPQSDASCHDLWSKLPPPMPFLNPQNYEHTLNDSSDSVFQRSGSNIPASPQKPQKRQFNPSSPSGSPAAALSCRMESPCTPGSGAMGPFSDSSDASEPLDSDEDFSPPESSRRGARPGMRERNSRLFSPEPIESIGNAAGATLGGGAASPSFAAANESRWPVAALLANGVASAPCTPSAAASAFASQSTSVKRSLSGSLEMAFSPSSPGSRHAVSTPPSGAASAGGTPSIGDASNISPGDESSFQSDDSPGYPFTHRGRRTRNREKWSGAGRKSGSVRRPPPTPKPTPQWIQRQRKLQMKLQQQQQHHTSEGGIGLIASLTLSRSGLRGTDLSQLHVVDNAGDDSVFGRGGRRSRTSHSSSAFAALSTSRMLLDISCSAAGQESKHEHTPMMEATDGHFSNTYRVLRQLGSGNFSDVFLVQSRTPAASPTASSNRDRHGAPSPSPQLFAVKKTKCLLRSRAERDTQLQEIQVYEHLARCAQAMRNAGDALHVAAGIHRVVEYFAAWQEEGFLHIKMEVCNAGNLFQYMARAFSAERLIPVDVLWDWTAQAAEGLRFLHACRYVHLDIKPENMFISETLNSSTGKPGRSCLKIGDLGLACSQGHADWETNGDSRYVAPELLSESTLRLAASDVFSLGMSLLQLAATTTLPQEEWKLLRSGNWLPIDRLQANRIPPAMIDLIRATLAPAPHLRPTSGEVVDFCAPFRPRLPSTAVHWGAVVEPDEDYEEEESGQLSLGDLDLDHENDAGHDGAGKHADDSTILMEAAERSCQRSNLLEVAVKAHSRGNRFHHNFSVLSGGACSALYVLRLADRWARMCGAGSAPPLVPSTECNDDLEVRPGLGFGENDSTTVGPDRHTEGGVESQSGGSESDDDDDEHGSAEPGGAESTARAQAAKKPSAMCSQTRSRLRLPSFHSVPALDSPHETEFSRDPSLGMGVSRQLLLDSPEATTPNDREFVYSDHSNDEPSDSDDSGCSEVGSGSTHSLSKNGGSGARLQGVKKSLF